MVQVNPEKSAILEALSSIHQQKLSYSEITLPEILKVSGVSPGAFYSLFTDKDDVALALLEKEFLLVLDLFAEEIDDKVSLEDRLKALISLQLEILGPKFSILRSIYPHFLQPFSRYSDFFSLNRQRYTNFLSELFCTRIKAKNIILEKLILGGLVNSFLAFNLTVLEYWYNDHSPAKQKTLNFLEKGIKNFLLISKFL